MNNYLEEALYNFIDILTYASFTVIQIHHVYPSGDDDAINTNNIMCVCVDIDIDV